MPDDSFRLNGNHVGTFLTREAVAESSMLKWVMVIPLIRGIPQPWGQYGLRTSQRQRETRWTPNCGLYDCEVRGLKPFQSKSRVRPAHKQRTYAPAKISVAAPLNRRISAWRRPCDS